MSVVPPNRNPAFEAVIRRLVAHRPQPRKVAGKNHSRPRVKKKAR